MKEITKETEMNHKRAGEIALKIACFRAGKREIRLDPSDTNVWRSLATKFEISEEDAKFFWKKVVLPSAYMKVFSETLIGSYARNSDEVSRCEEIALRIIRRERVDLDPIESKKWLEMLSKNTDVPLEEMMCFWIIHVLPALIANIVDWNTCYVIGKYDESFKGPSD